MANERTTREPLAATVGERLGEKAREGDTAGLDRAQEVVDDLRGAGWKAAPEGAAVARGEAAEPGGRGRGGERPGRERSRGRSRRGGGVGWALAAGLGTLAVVGMVRRAFGR